MHLHLPLRWSEHGMWGDWGGWSQNAKCVSNFEKKLKEIAAKRVQSVFVLCLAVS